MEIGNWEIEKQHGIIHCCNGRRVLLIKKSTQEVSSLPQYVLKQLRKIGWIK